MKYFFSAAGTLIPLLKKLGAQNFLCSYVVSPKEPKEFLGTHRNIIIDSGAFSAWNSGREVDIDSYIEYAERLDPDWTYINLDVIPKTGSTKKEIDCCIDKSKENFLYIKKKLKNVLPVYHYGEGVGVLKWYMEHTDYIGISPANDTNEKIKREFLNRVFDITRDKVKCHGLGYSSVEGMLTYPFYSVDSISYKMFWVNGQRLMTAKKLEFFQIQSIRKFLETERYVTRVWEERGVEWK